MGKIFIRAIRVIRGLNFERVVQLCIRKVPMPRIAQFSSLPTKLFVWLAVILMLMGWGMDMVTGSLWVHLGIHAHVLEFIGSTIFWFGYFFLWVLLPVAAFRPENRFYTRGDCQLRFKRVAFVAAILLAVHIWIFISIGMFFRGGFVGGA
jgi:hypothetical protein